MGTAGPTYSVPYNREIDRSNCALSDVRQVFNLTAVYQTPQFSNRALRTLVSNWQVSIAMQAKSAQFFTVTSGIDYALDGQGNERPNLVNASGIYSSNQGPGGWINSSAFANPATGTVTGNLGADNLKGPAVLQIDMALVRSFHVWEKTTLQARFEAYNVPNIVNFSNPVATLNSGTFGTITSDISGSQAGGLVANTGDPRILQLALKYLF